MSQLFQILGALLILVAYAAAQFQILDQKSYAYLLLNLVGSAILAWLAYAERQWGFLLLEGSWALLSIASLIARARGRSIGASHH